eukprot:m.424756 g.424756  ORF g.424756 m.424756 type:complete len:179 (-) comp21339_c0_seq1:934-1470(-)
MSKLSPVRRSVPNDNNCLFAAFVYLCDGHQRDDPSKTVTPASLRDVCAQAALDDPDPSTKSLYLGMEVQQYASWIKNTFNWGGENEIIVLAHYFGVEVAVVSCESLTVMVYGTTDNASARPRFYLLYTGQHYDPIVATMENSDKGVCHASVRAVHVEVEFEVARRTFVSGSSLPMNVP